MVAINLPEIKALDANGIDKVHYSIANGTKVPQGVEREVKVQINDTRGNVAWCNYTHLIKCKSNFTSSFNFQELFMNYVTFGANISMKSNAYNCYMRCTCI